MVIPLENFNTGMYFGTSNRIRFFQQSQQGIELVLNKDPSFRIP